MRSRIARAALSWAVSLAVLAAALLALRGRWEAVGDAGGLPGAAPAALAVTLYVVANGVLATSWRAILALVAPPLRWGDAAWIWGASQLTRYVVGPGQVAGRALLVRRHGGTATAGAVTALIELGWLISLTAALALGTLPWWLAGAQQLRWVAWAAAIPVLALAVGLVRPTALVALTARLIAWKPIDRLTGGRLRGAGDRLAIRPAQAARFTALYAINNFLRIIAFATLFRAVGGDLAEHLLLAVGAYSVGQLVGWLAVFAPGGVGPREGATFLIVAPVLGGGPALLLVAVTRGLELVAEIVFVAVGRLLRSDVRESPPVGSV